MMNSKHIIRTLAPLRTFSSNTIARSHIGRAPIHFPSDVSLKLKVDEDQHVPFVTAANSKTINDKATHLLVKGPLGEKEVELHNFVNLEIEKELTEAGNKVLNVRVEDFKIRQQKAIWGTTRALINNAVVGVTDGYTVPIKLVGVGYRASLEDNNTKVGLKVGYSHPIALKIPEGIQVSIPQPTRIFLSGIDKQVLGQFAAAIRRWREPEPYNQKGIFVGDETIKKKEIKKKTS